MSRRRQVSNVVDEPHRHLAMAADGDLLHKLTHALDGAALASGDRILIVNDITCGALPAAAARRGYKVGVVTAEARLLAHRYVAPRVVTCCAVPSPAGRRDGGVGHRM